MMTNVIGGFVSSQGLEIVIFNPLLKKVINKLLVAIDANK